MPIESDGHSRGNPRIFELIEHPPGKGRAAADPEAVETASPTIHAFPQMVEYFKVAGQPVAGPWPPHQQPRPDPTEVEPEPIAVPDPAAEYRPRKRLSIDRES